MKLKIVKNRKYQQDRYIDLLFRLIAKLEKAGWNVKGDLFENLEIYYTKVDINSLNKMINEIFKYDFSKLSPGTLELKDWNWCVKAFIPIDDCMGYRFIWFVDLFNEYTESTIIGHYYPKGWQKHPWNNEPEKWDKFLFIDIARKVITGRPYFKGYRVKYESFGELAYPIKEKKKK